MNEVESLRDVLAGIFQHEGRVLLGALLGALFITVARGHLIFASRRRLSLANQCILVLLMLGVGYLFEPLVKALVPMLSRGMAAFVAATVVIPVSLKAMVWLDAVDLRDFLQRWRR